MLCSELILFGFLLCNKFLLFTAIMLKLCNPRRRRRLSANIFCLCRFSPNSNPFYQYYYSWVHRHETREKFTPNKPLQTFLYWLLQPKDITPPTLFNLVSLEVISSLAYYEHLQPIVQSSCGVRWQTSNKMLEIFPLNPACVKIRPWFVINTYTQVPPKSIFS